LLFEIITILAVQVAYCPPGFDHHVKCRHLQLVYSPSGVYCNRDRTREGKKGERKEGGNM